MSQSENPPTTDLCSPLQQIFEVALGAYKKKTGEDLPSDPLFAKLKTCASASAIITELRKEFPVFGQPESPHDGLTKSLGLMMNVLYMFFATVGAIVGMVYSPASVVVTSLCVLFSAATKAVGCSQGVPFTFFEHIESCFMHLETYTEVPPTAEMTDRAVERMVEVLSILAITTKEIRQGRTKRFISKVMGTSSIEDVLHRLDKLKQDYVWMVLPVAAPGPETAQSVVANEVNEVLNGAEETGVAIPGILNIVSDEKGNQLRQDLRKWLSPPDQSFNHNIACSARHPGTGEWFTQGPMFADWKESGSLLWIHGPPGSGKTVLSSAIIENIKGVSNIGSAPMAYFYFDFMDARKQDAHALLSSLIIQLCDRSDSCCNTLLHLYAAHHHGSEKPSDDALEQCLEDMIRCAGQVPIYLVIDALDECPIMPGTSSREKVLFLLDELVELRLPNLRLCVTSREQPDIREVIEPLTSTSISLLESGQSMDIVHYIHSVVCSDKALRRWREGDKELVIKTLSERHDGRFRWVYCQLETLRHCLAPSVRRALGELPRTLDETYQRVLVEIPEQNRYQVHRLLQCLTVAVRPLRIEELAGILAVDFTTVGIPVLNVGFRSEDPEQFVLLAWSSLIAIVEDRGSRVVRFAHYTIKEFLTSSRLAHSSMGISYYHILPEPAHTIMAQACLVVLLLLEDHTDESLGTFPRVHYATEHWADHAKFENVPSHIKDGLDYLLDANKPLLAIWPWVHKINTWPGMSPEILKTVPLYYVAEVGLLGMAQHPVLKNPENVNARGDHHGTPLHAVPRNRHVDLLRLLLGGQTPLHSILIGGYLDIRQQLLDRGVDVNAHRGDRVTALHLAAYYGRLEFARMLLERKADVNARDHLGRTPLHRGLEHISDRLGKEYFLVIQLLLQHGADVDALDSNGFTPLHLTSYHGSLKAAQLLLECGANVHVRNYEAQTPLHCASWHGYPDVTQLLLEHGGDVDAQDDDRSTPLHLATYQGNFKAVQRLLEFGANIHMRNEEGKTPMQVASTRGHREIARLLSDKVKSEQGR